MKDLTIIIPIHELTEESSKRFSETISNLNSLDNIEGCEILIVGPKNVIDSIDSKEFSEKYNVELSVNKDETDFSTQVMHGVNKCKTKYFTIVGYDDKLLKTWLTNMEAEIMDKPNVNVFLTLVEVFDGNTKNFVGLLNEPVWASSFSEEMGYVDMESLKNYYDFNTYGAVFSKDAFLEVGGLKPSMKLTFWYEFMLRCVNSGNKVYVLPKLLYKHFINYEGSLMSEMRKNIGNDEAMYWLDLAKKEYVFKHDRKLYYGVVDSDAVVTE